MTATTTTKTAKATLTKPARPTKAQREAGIDTAPKSISEWIDDAPVKIGRTTYPAKHWNGAVYRNEAKDGSGGWLPMTLAEHEAAKVEAPVVTPTVVVEAEVVTPEPAVEVPTYKITMVGPNLRDQSKGIFHVHAYGCNDLRKAEYRGIDKHIMTVTGEQDMVTQTYPPTDFEYDEADWASYAGGEFYIAPCVNLPGASEAAPAKATKKINYTRTYDGPKRSVVDHIAQAFKGAKKGTFLSVGQIAKFTSTAYGDAHPSQGAVSAALHNSKKLPATITPGTFGDRGAFGATKS